MLVNDHRLSHQYWRLIGPGPTPFFTFVTHIFFQGNLEPELTQSRCPHKDTAPPPHKSIYPNNVPTSADRPDKHTHADSLLLLSAEEETTSASV